VPELRRLTYDSKALHPALSPDGAYVAYRFRDGERESVKLRNIANGSTIEVLPPTAEGYANLAFSPDGGYLYFTTLLKGVKQRWPGRSGAASPSRPTDARSLLSVAMIRGRRCG
jgi:Tol biopolymer transport system component